MRRLLALVVMSLVACTGDVHPLGPLYWNDIKFVVQSRPSPPLSGMNEFLVLANETSGKPAYNLIISIRTNGDTDWIQCIQDGRTGVYRRALKVDDVTSDVLAVRVQKGQEEVILDFPLRDAINQ